MLIPKEAFNKNGFINKQGALDGIPFGATTLGDNGCGFIAAYNVLKRLKRPINTQHLYNFFLNTVFFKGKFGISILQLVLWLFGEKAFGGLAILPHTYKNIDLGILWYKHSFGWHYITFYKEKEGFIFLNAGLDGITPMSFEEFLAKYSVSFLTCVIKVKKEELNKPTSSSEYDWSYLDGANESYVKED